MKHIRRQIREEAIKALERWGENDSVAQQVEALIGSLDDTLSDEVVLKELKALKKSGMPFQECSRTCKADENSSVHARA